MRLPVEMCLEGLGQDFARLWRVCCGDCRDRLEVLGKCLGGVSESDYKEKSIS